MLEGGDDPESIRLLTDCISLAEGETRSVETLARVVKFDDDFYGEVDLTRKKFETMIRNFNAGTYGQDIFIDVAHNVSAGAAGTIRKLMLDGNKLRGDIEWNPIGIDAIKNRGFRYFSIDYHEDWKDRETGKKHGTLLQGAGLTIRPRVKKLDPVNPDRLQLSSDDDDGRGCAVSPRFKKLLTEEITTMWAKLIKQFQEKLKGMKHLSDPIIKQLSESFESALEGITEEAQAKAVLAAFEVAGNQVDQQLAESGADPQTIKLDFSGMPAPAASAGMTKDDIVKLLQEQEAERQQQAKQLQESRDARVKQFTDALEANESFKSLSEDTRKRLLSAQDLITADMTEDQVTQLGEHQLQLAQDIAVASQLAARGFQIDGTPHISVDDSNNIKALQESVDKRLGLADMSEAKRYSATGGTLPEENKKLAEKVLQRFDQERAAQLHAEHKQLAGGVGVTPDVDVPVVWERTVIREALFRLVGLQFVNSDSLDFAAAYSIPFSFRDPTAAGRNDTRTYEGQGIRRAGVIQDSELAYNIPQKLAFVVSDELRYLTQARHLNWDAVTENQQNASRIIGEDIEQIIFNEVLHAADEFGAVAVTNENLAGQADGTDNVFVLAQFPVVRPRRQFDLQGNQVGSTVNPIVVTYEGSPIEEYDGTGEQADGTYYKLDYNLGELRLVDETGAIETPANDDTLTISYSHSTNAFKFDTDLGEDELVKLKWNDFLYHYGLRKSVIEDDRFHTANFGLMSGTAMTQIEQAEQFGANSKRPGTDLMADGNLGRIKDVPNFKTSAPGLWMRDQRVIVGERAVTRFRMTKPWSLSELENMRDANGRFTGQKEAYGDQFIVCMTPTPLKRAYTSILLYSASARVARAE